MEDKIQECHLKWLEKCTRSEIAHVQRIEGYMFKELRKGRPIKISSEVKRKDMMGFRVTRNIDLNSIERRSRTHEVNPIIEVTEPPPYRWDKIIRLQ